MTPRRTLIIPTHRAEGTNHPVPISLPRCPWEPERSEIGLHEETRATGRIVRRAGLRAVYAGVTLAHLRGRVG